MIVDAQIEVRPLVFAIDEQRGRLFAALVAAALPRPLSIAAIRRRGNGAGFTGDIGRRGCVEDSRTGKHVAGNGKSVAGEMSIPVNAGGAGMRRDAAARIHDVNLTVVASVISRRSSVLTIASAVIPLAQEAAARWCRKTD